MQVLDRALSGEEQMTKSDRMNFTASELALEQSALSSTMYISLSTNCAQVSAHSGCESAADKPHVEMEDCTIALQMVLVRKRGYISLVLARLMP